MKHILKYIYIFAFVFSVSFLSSSFLSFAASEELTINLVKVEWGTPRNYSVTYSTDSETIKIISFDHNGNTYYCIIDNAYGNSTYLSAWSIGNGTIQNPWVIGSQYFLNNYSSSIDPADRNFYFVGSTYYSNSDTFTFSGTIAHFDSLDIAKRAVESWDFTIGSFDPSLPFDFSGSYDANIGVPKITNLTYDGVTFENTDNREIEVMFKFDFFGWKYDSSRDDWVKPDYNNIIQSAKGNYVGQGSNYNGYVPFESFGNELDVIKAASIAYCTSLRVDSFGNNVAFNRLPDFKWYNTYSFALDKLTQSKQSLIDHVWSDNISSAQAYFKPYLNLSLQFFARYVGGQWIEYNMIYPVVNSAAVTGSTGGTTSSGDQIPQTEDHQTMETNDGGLTWEIIQNVNKVVLPGVDKYDVSVLQNAVNDYKNFLGQFPSLINYVFPFIPSWLTSWIAIAIAFSCVVAVIRLIRG